LSLRPFRSVFHANAVSSAQVLSGIYIGDLFLFTKMLLKVAVAFPVLELAILLE
jgi:hypothetical protein